MVQKHDIPTNKNKGINLWRVGTFVFAALLIVAILTSGFSNFSFNNITSNVINSSEEETISEEELKLIVLNDERCDSCDSFADQVISQLQSILPNLVVEEIDYNSNEGKDLYVESNLNALPALLFDKSAESVTGYDEISSFMLDAGEYNSLQIGASFDPEAEICDNGIDDTGDGKVDCEATECQSQWECVQKTDKPVVEVFVMSHCPYGTQIEKGIIPVVKTLGDKIDFQLKFVNYAMHGEKEIKEQITQYCVEKEYSKDMMIQYLECFLEDSDSPRCVEELSLNQEILDSCFDEVDSEYKIMEDFADQSTWMGTFPSFSLHEEDNIKYGVRGSPTLIINGATPSAGRDSKSILEAVCFAFKEAPEECNTELSSASPSPGFGYTETTGNTVDAGCGV